jgi:hypothetical protein
MCFAGNPEFHARTAATDPKEGSMKTYSPLVVPDRTRQLVAAGFLPGDAHPAPPGVLIAQVGGIIENSAFDADRGYGTGYILSLHIAVDRPAFAIWEWKLELPWENPQFQWLPEPQGRVFPDNMYQVPGCAGLKFPRDEVINHRRVLQRGRGLDGLLLGFGFESIPNSYRQGASIDASSVLLDEMGREFSIPVQFWANRMAKIDRKNKPKQPRKGRCSIVKQVRLSMRAQGCNPILNQLGRLQRRRQELLLSRRIDVHISRCRRWRGDMHRTTAGLRVCYAHHFERRARDRWRLG